MASNPNIAAIQGFLRAGRYREAHVACQAMVRARPGDAQLRYLLACAAVGLGSLDEAESLVRGVLATQPQNPVVRYLMGDVERLASRFSRAAETYGEALALEFGFAPAEGVEGRLVQLLELAVHAPVARWWARMPVLHSFGVSLSSAPPELPEAAWDRIASVPLASVAEEEFGQRFVAVQAILGFARTAPPEWRERAFSRAFLPFMTRALRDDRGDAALAMERAIYIAYVKSTENEGHFREAFASWKDPMREAAMRFAKRLPTGGRKPPGPKPRVAFFVHNITLFAHVQTLLEVVEGHAELEEPLVEPWLFYLGGDEAVARRFAQAGVKVEALATPTAVVTTGALATVRRRVAEEGIDVLAWISLAIGMPYAFAMRLAPRQVWWAMKYHALELPEIDGYLTGGSQVGGTKRIHDRTWAVGPVASAEWFAADRTPAAAKVRAELGARGVVYGSFGREEKLDSAAFLDAVARILREEPDAMFLWTGRVQLPSIQSRLEAAGVAGRCRFIGWVDTKLYAQVIDVFLDSYPFPCGFTLYEAMAAGKPVVLRDSAESRNAGINAMVAPLLAADPPATEPGRLAREIFGADGPDHLYLRALDDDGYVALAVRLSRDAGFRERTGTAARRFIEELMSDRREAARIYLGHLIASEPAPCPSGT